MNKSSLAVTVGQPEQMVDIEHQLQKLGYHQVAASPEDLAEYQYSKRELVEVFDSVDPTNASVLIAWRC
jgi:hypothetical protein